MNAPLSVPRRFLRNAFGGEPAEPPSFSVPEGTRVYAVGDVHGQLDLMRTLQGQIEDDARDADAERIVEIFLGDYVDRGPHSAGVIEALTRPGPFERVTLMGNHEDYFLRFLDDPDILDNWGANGGYTTLESYGVRGDRRSDPPEEVRAALVERMPPGHLAFLERLQTRHLEGEVLFTHAGIRPGVPLEDQDPTDLMWIRGAFLRHDGPLPVRVVHGHTPVPEPEVTPYRIGVDTGAFATGTLTAAVLEGDGVRFLSARR